tara:strand:- start:4534 stop:7887 length:3354 start_codon:yes stop_codon:yes gene_type:complete
LTDTPKKILVIGSGPIVIGQAAEFDYAGTQACKSLREEGIETILVNSNPATIMTDADVADSVYIEPLTVPVISRIIEREQPDAVLPTLGGQTGLNLAVELAEAGVLDQYGVRLLGSSVDSIKKAEDRQLFRELLTDIGEPTPPSFVVNTYEEAAEAKNTIGLPLVIRPAYTLGGTGGGIAEDDDAFTEIVKSGLSASPIHQVLVEKSIVGWKELEYEVMRDSSDNCITICNMENIDPMGVHTGDSIVVAPSQTLSDNEYQMLRTASLKIIRELGIEGGCNVQFALAPGDVVGETLPDAGRTGPSYYVIEVNPRVSRSSALASKATGYPIARVAAKIAIGMTLDEIQNAVTQKTVAAFEPALDYCVVKIPRWPFDKFPSGERTLGTQMKATGEVMAIDRTFEAAFQKAVRSLEISNRSIMWEDPVWFTDEESVLNKLPIYPNDQRLWALLAGLRKNVSADELSRRTGIDPWFTRSFSKIIAMERTIDSNDLSYDLLFKAKRLGFTDQRIGEIVNQSAKDIRKLRKRLNIQPVYKMVDTCAAEFEAQTPYFYSTYETENEAEPLPGKRALVLGSGPIRIGQGIEFDYCSVHAAWALQEEGVKSILVNSNPETVSTDFDTSDRLYFEPLDEESIFDIIDNERLAIDSEHGENPPSIVQFGGQTAINLSQTLAKESMPILGSTAHTIDVASDRHLFEEFLRGIDIPNPPGGSVSNIQEALQVANEIKYPVLVRPSYVLGGRAMEIVQTPEELQRYMNDALEAGEGRKVLIDKYFVGKEVEVDAVCDGESVLIPGIMEHVERAGVHSGDSMAIYPGLTLTKQEIATITDYTTRIGKSLNIKGLMNIQYVIVGGNTYRSPGSITEGTAEYEKTEIFVIEVNPRSSRTIPFISKVTGVPMVNLAVKAMLGKKLSDMGYGTGLFSTHGIVGVKAPVFSMSKLTGVDTYLGPEMKSTGEVMGIDYDYESAISKALIAADLRLPVKGSILLSISDEDKKQSGKLIQKLVDEGYDLFATEGTASLISELGKKVVAIPKRLNEGHPNVVDIIVNGTVDAVVNTITGNRSAVKDGFHIRRAAVEKRIPCFTSIDTATAAAESLTSEGPNYNVKSMLEYIPTPEGEPRDAK